jgi:hypothetical protein
MVRLTIGTVCSIAPGAQTAANEDREIAQIEDHAEFLRVRKKEPLLYVLR